MRPSKARRNRIISDSKVLRVRASNCRFSQSWESPRCLENLGLSRGSGVLAVS